MVGPKGGEMVDGIILEKSLILVTKATELFEKGVIFKPVTSVCSEVYCAFL